MAQQKLEEAVKHAEGKFGLAGPDVPGAASAQTKPADCMETPWLAATIASDACSITGTIANVRRLLTVFGLSLGEVTWAPLGRPA